MPDSFVQLPPDGTGKKLRTNEKTVGADVVHEQYMRLSTPPTYRAFTSEITISTAIARTSMVTIWHPSTATVTCRITKINLHSRISHTAGNWHVKTCFITGENTTPGGTSLTSQPVNRGSVASALIVRQSPAVPTRLTPLLDDYTKMAAALTGGLPDAMFPLYRAEDAEPITLRSGVAEGIEVSSDVIATLTGSPIVVIGLEWTEE